MALGCALLVFCIHCPDKDNAEVILPLFYKYKPLEQGILRQRIFSLLERYKVRLKDIYVLDFSKKTVKANAFVAGLGRTKQIFLSDTLVNEFSPQEIEVVLAHEMGHYLNRDMLKLVLSSLCSSLLSFFIAAVVLEKLIVQAGFKGISDIAGLPLLLMVLLSIGLILLPLQNGYSRILERKADHFSLKATGMPQAFISMMKRLGNKNFSDFSPSRVIEIFLYDHPPISKRIRMAEGYLPR